MEQRIAGKFQKISCLHFFIDLCSFPVVEMALMKPKAVFIIHKIVWILNFNAATGIVLRSENIVTLLMIVVMAVMKYIVLEDNARRILSIVA